MIFNLKGLYLITSSELIPEKSFLKTVESAIRGGASLLQFRDKISPEEKIIKSGLELHKLTKKYGIPLIINDNPLLAREIGAEGVHLGENDPDIESARKILGKESIIGITCYNKLENGLIAQEKGADYVAFGTPYSTPTKPGRKPTSIETLEEASKILDIPVFAIGGIFPVNAKEIIDTGVDGIAVITSVFGSDKPQEVVRQFVKILNQ